MSQMYCNDSMDNFTRYRQSERMTEYNGTDEVDFTCSRCHLRRIEKSPKLKTKRRLRGLSMEKQLRPSSEYLFNHPDVSPPQTQERRKSSESAIIDSVPEVIGVTSNYPIDFSSPAKHSYEFLTQRRLIDTDADLAEDAVESLDNNSPSSSCSSYRNSYEGSYEAVITTPTRNSFNRRGGSLRLPAKNSREFNRKLKQYKRMNSNDYGSSREAEDSFVSFDDDELNNNAIDDVSLTTPIKVLSSLSNLLPERGWFCKSCNKPKDECNCMCTIC